MTQSWTMENYWTQVIGAIAKPIKEALDKLVALHPSRFSKIEDTFNALYAFRINSTFLLS